MEFYLLLLLLVSAFDLWLSNCHVHEHVVQCFLSHYLPGAVSQELLRCSFSDRSPAANGPDGSLSWSWSVTFLALFLSPNLTAQQQIPSAVPSGKAVAELEIKEMSASTVNQLQIEASARKPWAQGAVSGIIWWFSAQGVVFSNW